MHPLIHLGYAVEFDLPLVAAEGLAYACSYYSAVGEAIDEVSAKTITGDSCFDLLTQFPFEKSKYETAEKKSSSYETRMGGFTKSYGADLVELCSTWACTTSNLLDRSADLVLSTVKVFDGSYRQGTLDFFIAHAVTGNHGVRSLLSILEPSDQVRLLNLNFLALAIVYGIQGVPSLQLDDGMAYDGHSNTWEALAEQASQTNDSHVIKIVRNLHQLERSFGQRNGLFHRPAVRCIRDVLSNGWCFPGIGFLPNH